MALLYPWATKEYLLWDMTIGQIILYHNLGMEIKYPDPDKQKEGVNGKTYHEIREEMREQGIAKDPVKEEMRRKYGEING